MLGWDLTDFGSGDFHKRGLILFTVRNGNTRRDRKSYAEKAMIVEEMQETPTHFHWSKMEDIINRGGGNLVMELFSSDEKEGISNKNITIKVDGVTRTVPSGEKIILEPGESICSSRVFITGFTVNRVKEKYLSVRSAKSMMIPQTTVSWRWLEGFLKLLKMRNLCICWFQITKNIFKICWRISNRSLFEETGPVSL